MKLIVQLGFLVSAIFTGLSFFAEQNIPGVIAFIIMLACVASLTKMK